MNEYFGYEGIEVSKNDDIISIYTKMLDEGKKEGYTPLIILDDGNGTLEEGIEYAKDDYGSIEQFTNECLQAYPSINVTEYLKENCGYEIEESEMEIDEEVLEQLDCIEPKERKLYLSTDTAYIVKIPTNKPYEVLAYIPMGGFNDCPWNDAHIAVAKKWYETYGAIPCALGCDTIQYYVPDPVKDFDEELGKEMFLYCPDIVYQGVETLTRLVWTNKDARFWFFWWD